MESRKVNSSCFRQPTQQIGLVSFKKIFALLGLLFSPAASSGHYQLSSRQGSLAVDRGEPTWSDIGKLAFADEYSENAFVFWGNPTSDGIDLVEPRGNDEGIKEDFWLLGYPPLSMHFNVIYLKGEFRVVWHSGFRSWQGASCKPSPRSCESVRYFDSSPHPFGPILNSFDGKHEPPPQPAGIATLAQDRFAIAWPAASKNVADGDGIYVRVFAADNRAITDALRISNPSDDRLFKSEGDQGSSRDRKVRVARLGFDRSSSDHAVLWVDNSWLRFQALIVGFVDLGLSLVKVAEARIPDFSDGVLGLPDIVGIQFGYVVFYRDAQGAIRRMRFNDRGKPIEASTVLIEADQMVDFFSVKAWKGGYTCIWGTFGAANATAGLSLDGKDWVGGPNNFYFDGDVPHIDTVVGNDTLISLWKNSKRIVRFPVELLEWVPTPKLDFLPAPTISSSGSSYTSSTTISTSAAAIISDTRKPTPLMGNLAKAFTSSPSPMKSDDLNESEIAGIVFGILGVLSLICTAIGWCITNIAFRRTETENATIKNALTDIHNSIESDGIRNKFSESEWNDSSQENVMLEGMNDVIAGHDIIDSALTMRRLNGVKKWIPWNYRKIGRKKYIVKKDFKNGLDVTDMGVEAIRASVAGLNVKRSKLIFVNQKRVKIQLKLNEIREAVGLEQKENYVESITSLLQPRSSPPRRKIRVKKSLGKATQSSGTGK